MILVAIGANLPGPDGASALETCRRAAAELDALPGLALKGLSRWYETDPVPPSGQPPYINGVALLVGAVSDPALLLAALQTIENVFGRVRGEPNAPRTLDLDIVAIGDLVRTAPDPILPHPRAHLRGFVLAPLVDVAPNWMHPILRQPAKALLAALPPDGVRLAFSRIAGDAGLSR
jgi:2-amino-4-hydroxy-6-hydroxymethyldihydropteridine diphosphokinase